VSISDKLGDVDALGAPEACVGISPFAGATVDGATPGVLVRIAGSGTDDGDNVGVIPALAAGKTCALGSRIISIMACAIALRSQPAKAVVGSPDGGSTGPGAVGAIPIALPGELLVFTVGIDFDTFQGAEGIRGERSR
jgi:hypothetical protein